MSRLLIICLVLGLVGCAGQQPAPATSTPQGQAFSRPNFVASDPAMVRSTGRPQVIVFFSVACDVCQSMRPTLHSLEDQYGTQADFIYLDMAADDTKAAQKDLAYTGQQPTIIFLSADGNEMDRLTGMQTREALTAKIDSLFAVG